MMFLDGALETQRTELLTELADAVSETRTAADQAAELNEDGETGLLRLMEILCATKVARAAEVRAGGHRGPLANVVAHLYACLPVPLRGAVGLAAYAELCDMMASLMLGEWFD